MVNARRVEFVGRLALAAVAAAAVFTTAEGARASEPLMSQAAPSHHYMRPPAIASRRVTASANVQYYGGHVISHVQVVPVNWGATVTSQVATSAAGFYAAVVDSPYLDWMGEYDTAGKNGVDGQPGSNQHVYRGTALPTVTITPSSASGTLTDAAVQQELQAQIAAGKLPAPQVDREGGVNTIYMLNFGPEVVVDDGSGQAMCDAWCAYHGSMSVSGVTGQVPYAIIPDFSQRCTQCVQGSVMATYGHAASHELAEAISDTEVGAVPQTADVGRPLAWLDPSNQEGEIGDICSTEEATLGGFTVQKEWSQRLGKCIDQDPALTLCTGATRPCRACTAADCSGATPTCDRDVTSTKFGQCTGCTTNATCTAAGKNVCDTTSGTCVGCLANSDCNGGTCDTSTHTCSASGTSSGSSGGSGSSGTSGSSGSSGTGGSSGSSNGTSSSGGTGGNGATGGDGSGTGAGPQASGCTQSGAPLGSNAPALVGLGLAALALSRRRRAA